jgi:hypothetical protein
MGLFKEAARVILEHLKSRTADPSLWREYMMIWDDRRPDVMRARRQLAALNPLNKHDPKQWPAAVKECTGWWRQRVRQGMLGWWEAWCYPSQALLHKQISFGLYGGLAEHIRRMPLPNVDGTLILRGIADGNDAVLTVAVPLTANPFIEPRFIIDYAKRQAGARLGPLPNREKEAFLQDFRSIAPDTGERIWWVCVTADTPLPEVQSLLTLLAQKQGFPCSPIDEQEFKSWLRAQMRTDLRDRPNVQQLVDELESRVHQQLLSHFDQPGTPWAWRDYIKKTTIGLAKGQIREECRQVGWIAQPEQLIDEVSGEPQGVAYPFWYVASEVGASRRTVERWAGAHGFVRTPKGNRALSEEQYAAFKQYWEPRIARTVARQALKASGHLPGAAGKNVQRWSSKGLSAEEIVRRAHQKSPRRAKKE